MKNKFILPILFILFVGCQQQYKRCEIEQPNNELQIYNDVLIELTENYFFERYLGKEGEKIMSIHRGVMKDSLELKKKKNEARNSIFGDSLKFKTIYLRDTLLVQIDTSNYFRIENYSGLEKLSNYYSTNKENIIHSINMIQLNYKAKRFKSCTFKVKSIKDSDIKTIDNEIGIVSFSKIFINKKGDEAVLCCNFRCGELCGKGYILQIKKIDNHWKIIKYKMTWVS